MDLVDATPEGIRDLARDLARGIQAMLELNASVKGSLDRLGQTFMDDEHTEYQDTVNRIQQRLEHIAENELDTVVKTLVEFANLLDQERGAGTR